MANIFRTPNADTVYSNELSDPYNYVETYGGNDTIYGGLGEDTIYAGQDYPEPGGSDDDLVLGDRQAGEASDDSIFGGYGNDTLYGDSMLSSSGAGGKDQLDGGDGNDSLMGGGGNDYLMGGAGNDTLYGEDGNDNLEGGSGADSIVGGSGNDTLSGSDFPDDVSSADTLIGGVGDDEYFVDGLDIIIEDASGGTDTVVTSLNNYTLGANLENLTFSGGSGAKIGTGNSLNNIMVADNAGQVSLYGLAGNDSLYGDYGNDRLDGGDGNDYFEGNIGNDTLIGGNGYDTARFYFEEDGHTAYNVSFTSNGDVTVAPKGLGNEGTDLLKGIEQINFFGGGVYKVYTGDGSNNTLTADPNFWSLLYGGGGKDSLTGGNGNDTLMGASGNDTLSGGNGYDLAIYSKGDTAYKASFTSNGEVQIAGSEGTDLLKGIEQINFANGYYKVYTGDASNNNLAADLNTRSLLYGGGGDDFLRGSNSNDTIAGGLDNDFIMGNSGGDILSGGDGNDYLAGNDGNDSLSGEAGNDILYGNQGNDTLLGGDGNDYLAGYGFGTEKDELTSGTGSDTFALGELVLGQNDEWYGEVFYNKAGVNDYARITDWDPKSSASDTVFDRIQLAGNSSQYKLGFSSVSGIGSSANDTEIFFNLNNSWERIGIIQDSINVDLGRDAVYI